LRLSDARDPPRPPRARPPLAMRCVVWWKCGSACAGLKCCSLAPARHNAELGTGKVLHMDSRLGTKPGKSGNGYRLPTRPHSLRLLPPFVPPRPSEGRAAGSLYFALAEVGTPSRVQEGTGTIKRSLEARGQVRHGPLRLYLISATNETMDVACAHCAWPCCRKICSSRDVTIRAA
jgi:hypothetical protein